jgi:hypothetical protein
MGGGRVTRRNRCCGRGCRWGFTRRLLLCVVNPVVRTIPSVEFRIRPAGRRDPHRPRPDVHSPCALTVPSQEQPVTITRDGYMPQTVQVTTDSPPDHPFWQHPPPTFVPNPVHVVLQPVPKSLRHSRGNRLVSTAAPSGASDLSLPPPPTDARFSAFPPSPPPPKQ